MQSVGNDSYHARLLPNLSSQRSRANCTKGCEFTIISFTTAESSRFGGSNAAGCCPALFTSTSSAAKV